MRVIGTQAIGTARFAMIFAALLFTGCSLFPPESPIDDEPVIVHEPPVPAVEVRPTDEIPDPPSLPSVSIVLTSKQPAYADVATELTHHFKDYEIYDLSDKSRPPVTVLRMINDSDSSAIVAIGLRAAQSSVAMAETPVIFSQVFNYQDHDLLTANSRGVASLAPLDAQIEAWLEIDPTISRIGIIVGEGHDELIAQARLAAQQHNLELSVQIAHSDQETLYFFKRMIRDIDGYWLFPDNRILSARVLQQVFEEAKRHNVPVVVPNDSMLKMGAAISMSTVTSDIAETIVKVVRMIQAGKLDRIPPLSPLSEIRIETNEATLKKPAVVISSTQSSSQAVDR